MGADWALVLRLLNVIAVAATNSAKNGAEVLLAQFEPQARASPICPQRRSSADSYTADPPLTEVISARNAGTEGESIPERNTPRDQSIEVLRTPFDP